MKKYLFLVAMLFFSSRIFSQDNRVSNLRLSISEEKDLSFHVYEPPLKVKAILNSLSDARNEYPEQLMESILSATNQKWVNHNTLEGEEDKQEKSHFDRIKSMDKDKNYFELQHKLTFNLGNITTAIIKFYFYQENEDLLSAAYVMQKVDGRWQRTSNSTLSTLSIIVMRMKSEVLQGIISGNSNDENIKAIASRVTTDGGLDLKKLEDEFYSWYDPEIDAVKIELYKDPKSW